MSSTGDLLVHNNDRNYAWWYHTPTNSSSNAATTSAEVLTYGTALISNSAYSTSNGRYTAPIKGLYCVFVNGLIDNSSQGGGGKYFRLYKNNANFMAVNIGYQSWPNNTFDYVQMQAHAIVYLDAGDYISIYAAEQMHTSSENQFGGYLIRGTV